MVDLTVPGRGIDILYATGANHRPTGAYRQLKLNYLKNRPESRIPRGVAALSNTRFFVSIQSRVWLWCLAPDSAVPAPTGFFHNTS